MFSRSSWRGEKAPLLSGLRLPVLFRFRVAPAGLAPAERRIGHYRADVPPRWAFSAAAARPRPGGGSGKRVGVSRPGSSGQSFAPLGQAQRGQSKDGQKSEPSVRYGTQTFHQPRPGAFTGILRILTPGAPGSLGPADLGTIPGRLSSNDRAIRARGR